jgi:hypothetical protein
MTPIAQRPLVFEEKTYTVSPYLVTAAVTASIALVLFPICFPAAIAFAAIAGWYLFSAAVVVLNRNIDHPFAQHLHGFMTEINAIVKSTFLFPHTFFDSYHQPKGDLKGRPILMVNGYLSFGSTWDYQRERLSAEGFGPIYTMNVGSGQSIKTYAKHVAEKAKAIKEETGRNDLTLIGHSKGGLVSSYYATTLAQEDGIEVKDVITVGSPLAGTPLAPLGFGQDAWEMRTESLFHRELRQHIADHPEIRFSQIASEVDLIVPKESALLQEGTWRQYTVKDLGHLALVFSSRVADQITEWLR